MSRINVSSLSALSLSVLVASASAVAQTAQPTQPTPQTAQPTPPSSDNEALYQQGSELRRQQRDADALALYQRLHEQSREPRALAQIALAEGALSRWIDADLHLTRALAASSDPWVLRNRAALDQAMANVRAHLGTLHVECPTAGAEVWVEGHRVGAADGAPLRVVSGTVVFEVRGANAMTVSRVATVAPNGSARERVTLATTASATSTNVGAGSANAAGGGGTRAGGGRRTLGLAGVASGGVLAVGGVVALVVANGQATAYNDDPQCPGSGAAVQPGDCGSRLSTGRTLEAVGWAGIGVGAALGIAGAVLMVTAPSGARSERARWECAPWLNGTGMACGGVF